MRTLRVVASAVVLAALLSACGGEGTETAETADRGAGSTARAETNGANQTGRSQGDAANDGRGSGRSSPGDLSADEICDRIPADDVEAALGISPVVASPSSTATPQCSYVFETDDGTRSDATIAALRRQEDLGGRRGEEAFDYVVDLNSSASRDADLTRTELSVGDRAILLSGGNLHFGVIQLGPRIATTIVSARAADAVAAADLTRLASVLAL
ncbi:MAG: hypothetical protein WD646_02295 [Actinomycetota bacterium]